MIFFIGGFPDVMNIGIINEESDCQTQAISNESCLSKDLSCHLIQQLGDPLKILQYNTINAAQQNARWDQLYMIFHFKKNFSDNFLSIFSMRDYRGLSELEISLTNDNPMFIHHVSEKFEDAFKSLIKNVAQSCKLLEGLSRFQSIETFGIVGSYLNDGLPAMMILLVFF
jgi:hypothetical protein